MAEVKVTYCSVIKSTVTTIICIYIGFVLDLRVNNNRILAVMDLHSLQAIALHKKKVC